MSLNLTVLTTSFPLSPNSVSGLFIKRLLDHLPDSISPTVVTPTPSSPTAKKLIHNNIMIIPFRYAPRFLELIAHNPGGIPVALKRHKWLYLILPLFITAMFISCFRYSMKSNIIFANWAISGVVGGFVSKFLRIPIVCTLRGEDINRARNNFSDRLILKLCLHLCDSIVVVSNSFSEWLRESFPNHSQKIKMIENGIDKNFLKISRNFEIPSNKYHLLTICSLINRKGVDQIIQALSMLNLQTEVEMVVGGSGPEKDRLRELVDKLQLNDSISFVGEVSPGNVSNLMADADLFILASHSEGRPNVILEAMASALPIVATDIEGNNELIVNTETGLLFRDGDIEELASKIKMLLNDKDQREKLGLNARNFILNNNLVWSNTASKYYQLFLTLI